MSWYILQSVQKISGAITLCHRKAQLNVDVIFINLKWRLEGVIFVSLFLCLCCVRVFMCMSVSLCVSTYMCGVCMCISVSVCVCLCVVCVCVSLFLCLCCACVYLGVCFERRNDDE